MGTQGDQYRARAEECRQLALVAREEVVKLEWLRLARSWEALAERSEKGSKKEPSE